MAYRPRSANDPAAQLNANLRPGERLLWSGRPDPKVIFNRGDLLLVPFTIMWGGFAVFWETSVVREGGDVFFVLWGIPFVAVGAYVTVGRFFYKAYMKKRTAYGVTNERALIATGSRAVTDFPLRNAPTTTQRTRDGNHVSVTFGPQATTRRGGGFGGNAGLDAFGRGTSGFAFYDVADVRGLLDALAHANGYLNE